MATINILPVTSALREIINKINELVGLYGADSDILDSLSKTLPTDIISYESTDAAYITGEVFTIATPGLYRVKTSGSGRCRYIMKSKDGVQISDEWLDNTAESSEFLLSVGDTVYFYATNTDNKKVTITLVLSNSILMIMKTLWADNAEILQKLEELTTQLQALATETQTVNERAQIIMDQYTQNFNAMNTDIQSLATRVKALEDKGV